MSQDPDIEKQLLFWAGFILDRAQCRECENYTLFGSSWWDMACPNNSERVDKVGTYYFLYLIARASVPRPEPNRRRVPGSGTAGGAVGEEFPTNQGSLKSVPY
jgi:hypothetical protein